MITYRKSMRKQGERKRGRERERGRKRQNRHADMSATKKEVTGGVSLYSLTAYQEVVHSGYFRT